MDRGDVNQMSFQWITAEDEWDESNLKKVVRTLISAKSLWDVSPVTFPAYPQTKAGLRSAKQVFTDYLETRLAELQENKAEETEQEDRDSSNRISLLERKLRILEKEI